MKNPTFVVTTNGQGYIDADEVEAVLGDPKDTATCMVIMKSDNSYEVAGSMKDIFNLLFPGKL